MEVEKPLSWDNLLVEVGFGRGDFTVRLARENPDRVVLGFELSGISIEKLLKRVKRENIKNVFCVPMDAFWGFYFLLKDSSVEKIFMNYPDPWFKKKHHKRRLTSERNLYLFARKLKNEGEIVVRTDHYPFVEYTLQESEKVQAFKHKLKELDVEEPLTKYERKWLSMGKKLYELRLIKVKEPKPTPMPKVREVKEVFPVKVESKEINIGALENREERLEEQVILKTFRVFEGKNSYLVEVLLSEEGFVQKFFVELREKNGSWIVDLSKFSQVLRTERIQRTVEFIAKEVLRP